MRFEFNGNLFRIAFRHEKSIRVSDHVGHTLQAMHGAQVIGGREVDLRVVLFCATCKCLIGDTVPKCLRKRRTRCMIQYSEVRRRLKENEEIGGTLLASDATPWRNLVTGTGTPNTKAGDRFNKEDGRKFSLANALASRPAEGISLAGTTFPLGTALSEDFKEAVLQAYYARKPIKAVTHVG